MLSGCHRDYVAFGSFCYVCRLSSVTFVRSILIRATRQRYQSVLYKFTTYRALRDSHWLPIQRRISYKSTNYVFWFTLWLVYIPAMVHLICVISLLLPQISLPKSVSDPGPYSQLSISGGTRLAREPRGSKRRRRENIEAPNALKGVGRIGMVSPSPTD